MLPGHCKDVAVKYVDFDLTAENIEREIRDKKAYTRCDHYVLHYGDDVAVVAITKADGKDLFRPIVDYRIIALPEDVVVIIDPDVDVINPSSMAKIAEKYPGKVVVVEGLFGHVSFVMPDEIIYLDVLDVIPPSPSKLSVLVDRALLAGLVHFPVIPRYEEIDLNEIASGVETSAIVFPCESSGLKSEKILYYLDQIPDINEDATLVGCDLSGRIYRTLYHRDIDRVEMCPKELAPNDGRKRLVKCCRVRDGYQLKDNMAIVPWGATVQEVADAINALLAST
ncbi:MAG: hypothetical protein GX369_04975 [Euryarchaeota archaeon]|nr:hypothetical protein [Euryarchaeota archaeon]